MSLYLKAVCVPLTVQAEINPNKQNMIKETEEETYYVEY